MIKLPESGTGILDTSRSEELLQKALGKSKNPSMELSKEDEHAEFVRKVNETWKEKARAQKALNAAEAKRDMRREKNRHNIDTTLQTDETVAHEPTHTSVGEELTPDITPRKISERTKRQFVFNMPDFVRTGTLASLITLGSFQQAEANTSTLDQSVYDEAQTVQQVDFEDSSFTAKDIETTPTPTARPAQGLTPTPEQTPQPTPEPTEIPSTIEVEQQYAIVKANTGALNVRSTTDTSTGNNIQGTIGAGDEVVILGEKKVGAYTWYRVNKPIELDLTAKTITNSVNYWVRADYFDPPQIRRVAQSAANTGGGAESTPVVLPTRTPTSIPTTESASETPNETTEAGELLPKLDISWSEVQRRFPNFIGYMTETQSLQLLNRILGTNLDANDIQTFQYSARGETLHLKIGETEFYFPATKEDQDPMLKNLYWLQKEASTENITTGISITAIYPDMISVNPQENTDLTFRYQDSLGRAWEIDGFVDSNPDTMTELLNADAKAGGYESEVPYYIFDPNNPGPFDDLIEKLTRSGSITILPEGASVPTTQERLQAYWNSLMQYNPGWVHAYLNLGRGLSPNGYLGKNDSGAPRGTMARQFYSKTDSNEINIFAASLNPSDLAFWNGISFGLTEAMLREGIPVEDVLEVAGVDGSTIRTAASLKKQLHLLGEINGIKGIYPMSPLLRAK